MKKFLLIVLLTITQLHGAAPPPPRLEPIQFMEAYRQAVQQLRDYHPAIPAEKIQQLAQAVKTNLLLIPQHHVQKVIRNALNRYRRDDLHIASDASPIAQSEQRIPFLQAYHQAVQALVAFSQEQPIPPERMQQLAQEIKNRLLLIDPVNFGPIVDAAIASYVTTLPPAPQPRALFRERTMTEAEARRWAQELRQQANHILAMLQGQIVADVARDAIKKRLDDLPADIGRQRQLELLLEGIVQTPAPPSSTGLPFCEDPMFVITLKNWKNYLKDEWFQIPPVIYEMIPAMHQPLVNLQIGNSCGNHTVFNAKALAELVTEKKPITPQVIRERVRALMGQYRAIIMLAPFNDFYRSLYADEMEDLAGRIKVENIHFLGIVHSVQPAIPPEEKLAIEDIPTYFFQAQEKLQASPNQPIAHYVCQINRNHWILITFIRQQPGARPIIYYCDSQNYPLGEMQAVRESRAPVVDYVTYLNGLWR